MSEVEKVESVVPEVAEPESKVEEPQVEETQTEEPKVEELSEVKKAARAKKVVEMGGGAVACIECEKRSYPAETVYMEGLPRHRDCFKCCSCSKKIDTTINASIYDHQLYCKSCFTREGLARKQAEVKWTGSSSTAKAPVNPAFAKLGGGGNPCTACSKTVYPGEQVNYDGKAYHKDCINCSVCKNKSTINNVNSFEGELVCLTCWNAGNYNQKQLAKRAHGPASTSTAKAPLNPALAKLGGGGTACTACSKTVYTGEQVNYDGKPYHKDCINCSLCKNKATINNVNSFEGELICLSCWNANNYNLKQLAKRPQASTSTAKAPTNPLLAKLGGGGNKCNHCDKTVYPAEQVNFEKGVYHRECLICGDCNKRTTVTSLNIYEGKLVCGPCWASNGYARLQLFGGSK